MALFRWVLVVTVLYLFWQISLSGAILTAASEQASENLSLLAKRTVGFGTALFVFRLIISKEAWYSARREMTVAIALILAIPLGFCAMWAEDAIVSHFADKTTGKERLEARTILIFNQALLKGGANIPGLSDTIQHNKAKIGAFSKVLGFAIWNNPELMSQISAQAEPLLAAAYGQEAYDRIDREYARYVEAFKEAQGKIEKMETFYRQIDFAQQLAHLNKRLADYAACQGDQCRKDVQAKLDRDIHRRFLQMAIPVVLEDFCKKVGITDRYVMGRRVESGSSRICTATEQELQAYVRKGLDDKKIHALPELENVPREIARKLTSDRMLNLEQWRKLWASQIRADLAQKVKDEFADASRYAKGGKDAGIGRTFAIGVFLPPVALGFSILVCFLHLMSLIAAIAKKKSAVRAEVLFCTGICILPAIFATSTPLSGLAGIYAKWLVFWEGALFPFGIFRWLIS